MQGVLRPLDDTIVAIASAHAAGSRGIVRLSGPRCLDILQATAELRTSPAARRVQRMVGEFCLPSGRTLPAAFYLWPTSRSYTRQPTLEIHTIGSPPLLEQVLAEVCRHGARLAQPGEFTLRAFLAGRIDLTQAEAVLGVIDAEGDHSLQVALRQLAGGLAHPLSALRGGMLDMLADLEAELDFADEDIEFLSSQTLLDRLDSALQSLAQLRRQLGARATRGAQFKIVLMGSPNAGKSSLFNALTGSRQAIVAAQAGTTRDYLTAEIEIEGTRCELADTAGLDGSAASDSGYLDEESQSRARRYSREADLRLLCIDSSQPLDELTRNLLAESDDRRLVVLTKCDLPMLAVDVDGTRISTHQEQGLGQLWSAISARLHQWSERGDAVIGTAERCRESIERAYESLSAAREAAEHGHSREFIAGDLRLALEEIGRVAGVVVTNDLLDRIFSRFCIGK